jgi:hypothetical protein
MKQITQSIADVDVELITFHEENIFETFTKALNLDVKDVPSVEKAIAEIKARRPLAFFKRNDDTYILITKKEEAMITNENGRQGGHDSMVDEAGR